jgi:integrase
VEILKPIWLEKPETARKARIILCKVLQLGFLRMKAGDTFNPALWKGNLEHWLPKQKEDIRHQPSLDYRELPEPMKRLKNIKTFGARALEFTILTATQANEVCMATWQEVEGGVWVIPKERMKGRSDPHRVPWSPQAMRATEGCRTGKVSISGQSGSAGISASALLKLVKNLNPEMTVHGFRASFRGWATEESGAHWRDVEACLAHMSKTRVERAYARGDILEARRRIMEEWADFLEID